MSTSPKSSSHFGTERPTYPSKLIELAGSDDVRLFFHHYFASSAETDKFLAAFAHWLANDECAACFFQSALRRQFPVKKAFEKRILKMLSNEVDEGHAAEALHGI